MIQRRGWLMIGVLSVALLLAFPLRETINEVIIVPIAYLLWSAGLIYHALHQLIWWIAVLIVVFYIFVNSLISEPRPIKREPLKGRPPKGSVETLAAWIQRGKSGIYFKWLIANRLGKLAHQLLSQRESGKTRSVFAPLTGIDWEPSQPLQKYLEAGLQGSFADYPNANGFFSQPKPTPLDHDVKSAVEFLEEQLRTD